MKSISGSVLALIVLIGVVSGTGILPQNQRNPAAFAKSAWSDMSEIVGFTHGALSSDSMMQSHMRGCMKSFSSVQCTGVK